MKIVDLTQNLNEGTPVYPGDPRTKIESAGVFEKDGYNDHLVSVGTHVGTHIDAPLHMIPNGKTLDQFTLEQFVGRGKYIKVENKTFDIKALEQAGIGESDIVLFHTGMDELYGKDDYFKIYPEIPEEVAKFLSERKVKIVGMDMASPDYPPFKIHKLLLGSGVLIIENLTNLSELAGKEFEVYALPIKLQIDAAPARVIAEVK